MRKSWVFLNLAAISVVLVLWGCGGKGTDAPPATPTLQLGIAAPTLVTEGDQRTALATPIQGATYTWEIANGSITSGGTTNTVSFTAGNPGTTTLSCTAVLGQAHTLATAPMEVLPLPVISSFQADPPTISPGESLQLSADFVNGTGTVQPGNLPISSGIPITVTPSETLIYTLNDTNEAGGNAAYAIMVTVLPPPTVPPVILSFTSFPLSVPANQTSTLSWSVSGASHLSIDNGIGTVTRNSVSVNPPVATTYTLTATNAMGSATARATVDVADHAVYIVATGYTSPGSYVPGFWINGRWIGLQDDPSATQGFATSIATSPKGLFIGGYKTGPGYWLNQTWVGLEIPPGADDGGADSIALSGDDIYVGGSVAARYGPWLPGYWKNGAWTGLSIPANTTGGEIRSIAVSAANLHIAGVAYQGITAVPCYWLNDARVDLPYPEGSTQTAIPNCLTLSGSHVYIGGRAYVTATGLSIPGYWLDGEWVGLNLPSGSATEASVNSIAVSNGNVYAAGFTSSAPLHDGSPGYWLDGNWVDLVPPLDSNGTGYGCLVSVSGNDVYVAGQAGTGTGNGGEPGYWLNGAWVALPLPPGCTSARVAAILIQ